MRPTSAIRPERNMQIPGEQISYVRRIEPFDARALNVSMGVCMGEALDLPGISRIGDIYRLLPGTGAALALPVRMQPGTPGPVIARDTALGSEGDRLIPAGRHLLMSQSGAEIAVLMIRHAASGRLLALPLAPVPPRTDFTLIASDERVDGGWMRDFLHVSRVVPEPRPAPLTPGPLTDAGTKVAPTAPQVLRRHGLARHR